jgi:hypothetical protein
MYIRGKQNFENIAFQKRTTAGERKTLQKRIAPRRSRKVGSCCEKSEPGAHMVISCICATDRHKVDFYIIAPCMRNSV